MKKVILNVLKTFAGIKSLQIFYKHLHRLSLYGMNFGNGGDFNESGELNALKYVKKCVNSDKPLIVFDVGANKGNYSKAINNLFGDKTIIHAFEPSKKNI